MSVSEIRYVNMAMDSGTVLRLKTLCSMVTNPWYVERFPVIWNIDSSDSFDVLEYELFVDRQLQEMFLHGIVCVGIISDN